MGNKKKRTRDEIESCINQVSGEAAELSGKRKDQEKRLTGLRAELERIEDQLERKSAGAASTARPYASVRPGANEANLDSEERETLDAARNAVKEAEAAGRELDRMMSAREEELEELLEERDTIVTLSAADELISVQARTKEAADEVAAFRDAIAQQEKNMSSAMAKIPPETDLTAKRADILAEIAIGGAATSADLEEIDKEIQEQSAGRATAKKQAEPVIANASHTIDGLRRKLEMAENELRGLQARRPAAFHTFLRVEAEKIGLEYLDAVNSLEASFRRLIAIDRIMANNKFDGIAFVNSAADMMIPAFRLKALEKRIVRQGYGPMSIRVVNTVHAGRENEKITDIAAENDRWRKAGIEI